MNTARKLFGIDSSRQEPLEPANFEELTILEPDTALIGEMGKSVITQMWQQIDEAETYARTA